MRKIRRSSEDASSARRKTVLPADSYTSEVMGLEQEEGMNSAGIIAPLC
jgi:hypothetical protein